MIYLDEQGLSWTDEKNEFESISEQIYAHHIYMEAGWPREWY